MNVSELIDAIDEVRDNYKINEDEINMDDKVITLSEFEKILELISSRLKDIKG